MKPMKYSFIKIITLCLVLSMVAPVVANGAVVEPALPMASLYVSASSLSVSFTVCFNSYAMYEAFVNSNPIGWNYNKARWSASYTF